MILVLITRDEPIETMNLSEAAARLGVHYMTAYRYVRLGQLPATQSNGRWVVRRDAVDELRRTLASPPPAAVGSGRRRRGELSDRLLRFLREADEPGAWTVIERALATGYTPSELYLDLLAPALQTIGDQWANGEVKVDDEHKVTAVALRLVGRLGPRFVRRGRKRGTVVLGAAPGDPHALPVAMLADIVRGRGYRVVDLGGNVPVQSYVDAGTSAERILAVGVSVSDASCLGAAADVVQAVHERLGVPVLVGGPATDEQTGAHVGSDGWAPDAEAAGDVIERLRDAQDGRSQRA
ncbi:MAG TPA: B12-binding domain-containing protein [Acidimicrobiales bacterium]